MVLKLSGNPCEKKPDYRKSLVMYLDHLEELDGIKVIQAERLAYKGLVKVDVQKLLDKFTQDKQEEEAKEKMEKELYLDYMESIGVESSERMQKSLNEFAELKEFDELQKKFNQIINDAKDKFEVSEEKRKIQGNEIFR